MKARGFTLLELVIVMVLISVTGAFGSRFIADSARLYLGSRERAEALSHGRFAIERLTRELAAAYGPSVRIADNCVYFVPALSAGQYQGNPKSGDISFILSASLWNDPLPEVAIAIMAGFGDNDWAKYPATLPKGVNLQEAQDSAQQVITYPQKKQPGKPDKMKFKTSSPARRYTLLQPWQVSYCISQGILSRNQKTGSDWQVDQAVTMLTGLSAASVFTSFEPANQIVQLELDLQLTDGELPFPQRIRVWYEQ
jgi:MSHA biogenesis protein MshO